MGGVLAVSLFNMEVSKTAPAHRSLLELAYAQPAEKTWRHRQTALPGPLYDATVIGLFIVLGVAYLM